MLVRLQHKIRLRHLVQSRLEVFFVVVEIVLHCPQSSTSNFLWGGCGQLSKRALVHLVLYVISDVSAGGLCQSDGRTDGELHHKAGTAGHNARRDACCHPDEAQSGRTFFMVPD